MGLLHCPLGGHLCCVPYYLSLLYTCSSLELPVSDRIYKKLSLRLSSEKKKKKRGGDRYVFQPVKYEKEENQIWGPPPRLVSGPYSGQLIIYRLLLYKGSLALLITSGPLLEQQWPRMGVTNVSRVTRCRWAYVTDFFKYNQNTIKLKSNNKLRSWNPKLMNDEESKNSIDVKTTPFLKINNGAVVTL